MRETGGISEATAERYVATVAALAAKAREAVDASFSPQGMVWKQKILPMLEVRRTAAQAAATHFAIGDERPLVTQAKQSLALGREMDGYSMDFAGEKYATELKQVQQFVVFAAWQVCQSAGAV